MEIRFPPYIFLGNRGFPFWEIRFPICPQYDSRQRVFLPTSAAALSLFFHQDFFKSVLVVFPRASIFNLFIIPMISIVLLLIVPLCSLLNDQCSLFYFKSKQRTRGRITCLLPGQGYLLHEILIRPLQPGSLPAGLKVITLKES